MAGKKLKTFQYYGYGLIQILIEPKRFFTELPENASMVKSSGFLILCGLFYTGARILTGNHGDPVRTWALLFFSSVGMAFVSTCVSYMIMMISIGRKTGFVIIFSVHAFSASIILLISWVSFFFWVAEIWKWWLVYTGFRNAGRLSGASAGLILFMTMAVHSFLFFYFFPVFFKL